MKQTIASFALCPDDTTLLAFFSHCFGYMHRLADNRALDQPFAIPLQASIWKNAGEGAQKLLQSLLGGRLVLACSALL